MRLKKGYIVALLVIILGYSVMPWIEGQAKAERGYAALGGEYLIPVMATVIGVVILWIADERQKEKERKRREKYKNLEFVIYAKKCSGNMRKMR